MELEKGEGIDDDGGGDWMSEWCDMRKSLRKADKGFRGRCVVKGVR